jgi:uncharacterized phiE125 gp8 family phage protein
MMLTELTAVPGGALPVLQFRDHVRLSTGFADDSAEDGLLETYLCAATAAVEAWTGKALVERDYALELHEWTDATCQPLPVAPVTEVTAVALIDARGVETQVPEEAWQLRQDRHRPVLAPLSLLLPTIPSKGQARVVFRAGFGPSWADVPPDLAHAVIMLAAYYYEYRHDARSGTEEMPFGVARLLAAWRTRRLGRGAW